MAYSWYLHNLTQKLIVLDDILIKGRFYDIYVTFRHCCVVYIHSDPLIDVL